METCRAITCSGVLDFIPVAPLTFLGFKVLESGDIFSAAEPVLPPWPGSITITLLLFFISLSVELH
jgi:hypothetical protein